MAPGIADKKNNTLPIWGNEKTMNLNNLILTNILSSHYFKVNLYQLKTYHEVIDEIYYQVSHLEPWEKGSRKTSGQTGMCGGVRGVGAGGIVSTAYCILYKLFTLKLTRKQLVGLINHNDSPYIRALGFMYIRYTQPPGDLWDWYEPYLKDEESVDVKAGGGQIMTIGEILHHFLSKLEWFSTLFPRIPVPIQKDLEKKLSNWQISEVEDTGDKAFTEEIWRDTALRRPKTDISDCIRREEERQIKDREKHGSSSMHHYHHSTERSRKHSPSRERSRSPFDSKSYKEDSRKHGSRYTEPTKYHKHRDHSSQSRNDSDRLSKNKYVQREERNSVLHSYSPDRKHSHSYSSSRSRH